MTHAKLLRKLADALQADRPANLDELITTILQLQLDLEREETFALTGAEIAKALGVTDRTLARYRVAGMPYRRSPYGRYSYDLSAVKAWLVAYSAGARQRGPFR